jgi:hypothetical protein
MTPLTVVVRAFAWFRVNAIPSSPCPAIPEAVSVYCWSPAALTAVEAQVKVN